MPRYLIIGSGGREHAIAWKLAQEADATVFVAPGSAGISTTAGVHSVQVAATDHAALARFATEQHIDLTVVGPEAPLCAGIVDDFRAAGLAILGPTATAARLEGSKAFAKDVMTAANVPTASYVELEDLDTALSYVAKATHPLVIKADGLAAGKGVVVSHDADQSAITLRSFMGARKFGDASARVIIEECLTGPEMSFMVVTDGEAVVPLSTSRDHKRLRDGDRGPNTGGMGAVTPSPDTSDEVERWILDHVIDPTLAELRARGLDFRGFLYAGLMLTPDGPRVLEFNVRLGDPETQAILFAMEGDLGPTLRAAADGALEPGSLATRRCACCVVLASAGYPVAAQKGDAIGPIDVAADDAFVFHAGTTRRGEQWATSGGRVLGVTARGDTADEARARAYAQARDLAWPGCQMRSDIGTS